MRGKAKRLYCNYSINYRFISQRWVSGIMSQIKSIFAGIIGLIFIYFFMQTARSMGAPNIFTLVAGVMVVMILFNVGRSLIRGY